MSATVENGLSYFEEYQKLLDLREDAKKIIGKVYRTAGGGGRDNHYLVVGMQFGRNSIASKYPQNSWDVQYKMWDRYPKSDPHPDIHLCAYKTFMRCTEPVDK